MSSYDLLQNGLALLRCFFRKECTFKRISTLDFRPMHSLTGFRSDDRLLVNNKDQQEKSLQGRFGGPSFKRFLYGRSRRSQISAIVFVFSQFRAS